MASTSAMRTENDNSENAGQESEHQVYAMVMGALRGSTGVHVAGGSGRGSTAGARLRNTLVYGSTLAKSLPSAAKLGMHA